MVELRPSSPYFPDFSEVDPPVDRLFAEGDTALLRGPGVAVVGTRRPSRHGARAAIRFAGELARRGWTIVSGLAVGIDTHAHEAALAAGGKTIAVLGSGLARLYPRENTGLAQTIVRAGGCLVSEYPPEMSALPFHFPLRNRIIAAMASGTVVVEAALKSGSLITALRAIEIGREVFAVPGLFDEPSFAGSHRLLRDGATLVTDPDEICQALGSPARKSTEIRGADATLVAAFAAGEGVATLEELFSRTSCTLSEVLDKLEEAKRGGFVAEVSPQQFVWIGGRP